MPLFTYQCHDCGLRFSTVQAESVAVVACKRCKKDAQKLLAQVGNFSFAHRPDRPEPQTTGASAIDHDIDVVIGRSAQANLREFERRQDYKRTVLSANRASGKSLSRLDDGRYFVMTDEEREAARRGRLVHEEVMHRVQAWKKTRKNQSQAPRM